MKRIIKYILLFLSCLFIAINLVTAEGLPHEKIMVHLSEHYLLAGENLGFSVMVSNPKDLPDKQISTLAFVELLNTSNQSVVRQKILLKNGIGSGVISLPDSLSTGNYYFTAYTSWMRNFGHEEFAVSKIVVMRPGDDFSLMEKNAEPKIRKNTQQELNENLVLSLEQTSFSNRESVKVKLEFDEMIGNAVVSVAVSKKGPAITENYQEKSDSSPLVEKVKFLPDYKGILLTGFLRNKQTSEPMANHQVFLSFPGENVELKHTTTENNGKFRFLLDPVAGEKDMVFLTDSENAGVWLDEKYCETLNIVESDSLILNKEQVAFFTDKYINRQLQRRYNQHDLVIDSATKKSASFCFYDDPVQILKTKDYIQLDSLHEYFYELIPSVQLSRKNKKYTMRVSNSDKNYHFGNNPAIFVDGVYYPYPSELMRTDAGKIDRIEVIPEIYYYRDLTFDGIVSVYSKNADFMDFPLLPNMSRVFYNLAEPNKSFSTPAVKTDRSSNLPDLRWLVYWHPEIKVKHGKSTSIEFFTSDLKGDFEITVAGITESGEKIRLHKTIVVE